MKNSVKNYFLVDYENVSENGLKGVNYLDGNDNVYIFYSKNNEPQTIKHKDLYRFSTNAKVKYVPLQKTGKNALDFMIAYEVGSLSENNTQCSVSIISEDNGFKVLKTNLESSGNIKNVNLNVFPNISIAKRGK